MDIKEIQKMGNSELLTRYSHLHIIKGSNNVYNKPIVDDDLDIDIHHMKDEIMFRMSRGVIDDTSFTDNLPTQKV